MISAAAQTLRDSLVRDTLDGATIAQKRQAWEKASADLTLPAGVDVSTIRVGAVACLQCVPRSGAKESTLVYCHGGGLVEGSANVFAQWSARLALLTSSRVLTVDYRLAPENPYPAALDDVLAVCLALQADSSISRLVMGADSSGCSLALAVLSLLERKAALYPQKLFLLSPSVDFTFSGASINENRNRDPVVSIDVLKHYAMLYAGKESLQNPLVSSLYADLRGFPPLLVFADEHEILYSDATRLVERVRAAAGVAQLYSTNGLWHVWPVWGDFPESCEALNVIKEHLNTP